MRTFVCWLHRAMRPVVVKLLDWSESGMGSDSPWYRAVDRVDGWWCRLGDYAHRCKP